MIKPSKTHITSSHLHIYKTFSFTKVPPVIESPLTVSYFDHIQTKSTSVASSGRFIHNNTGQEQFLVPSYAVLNVLSLKYEIFFSNPLFVSIKF